MKLVSLARNTQQLHHEIDLHSNNSGVVLLDGAEKVIYQKKLDNDLALIIKHLSMYKKNHYVTSL